MSPSIDFAGLPGLYGPLLKLKENEKIVWSQSSGPFLGGSSLGKVFLAFGVLFFFVGMFPLTGTSCGAWCNWLSVLSAGPGLLFATLGGFIVWKNQGGRSNTEHYLTNFRLVEAKAGRVVGQVPRKLFKGEPVDRFLAQDSCYEVNGARIYNVTVRDPESGEILMRLTDLPRESIDTLAALGKGD